MNITDAATLMAMSFEARRTYLNQFFERLAQAKIEEYTSPAGTRLLKVEWGKSLKGK